MWFFFTSQVYAFLRVACSDHELFGEVESEGFFNSAAINNSRYFRGNRRCALQISYIGEKKLLPIITVDQLPRSPAIMFSTASIPQALVWLPMRGRTTAYSLPQFINTKFS